MAAVSTSVSPSVSFGARRLLLEAARVVLIGMLLLLVFEKTDLDRWITDFFYDAATRRFPLRYDWFLEVVVHHWCKYLVVVLVFAIGAAFLLSFRIESLRPRRRVYAYLVLAMLLGPMIVSMLKNVTAKHCPWDLDIYGGFAPYTRLLDAPPPGVKPGACFPGGHASSGFSLLAFYFVANSRRRRAIALYGGLAAGFLLGLGRIAQGAHFLSHNLWAALVCWTVALAIYLVVVERGAQAPRPQSVPA